MGKKNKNHNQQRGSQQNQQQQAAQGGAAGTTVPPTPPVAPAPEITLEQGRDFVKRLPPEPKPPGLKKPTIILDKPNNTTPPTGCEIVKKISYSVKKKTFFTTLYALIGIGVVLSIVSKLTFLILTGLGKELTFIEWSNIKGPLTFVVLGIVVIYTHKHVWLVGQAQKILVFENSFSENKIVWFPQGFSLKPYWFTPFKKNPEIDLQKVETLPLKLKVLTSDNVEMSVGIEISFRVAEQRITEYLGFDQKEIKNRLNVVVEDLFNQIFAQNSWETVAYYRGEITLLVRNLFGSESYLTGLEQWLGILVLDPKLNEFEPTERGQLTATILWTKRQLTRFIDQLNLENPGMEKAEIARMAQRLVHITGLTDTKITVAAPAGMRAVMLGDDVGAGGRVNI